MPAIKLVDAAVLPTVPVVVGAFSRNGNAGPELDDAAAPIDAALQGRLSAALKAVGASGKADEVTKIATLGLAGFPLVVVTGLGRRTARSAPSRPAAVPAPHYARSLVTRGSTFSSATTRWPPRSPRARCLARIASPATRPGTSRRP